MAFEHIKINMIPGFDDTPIAHAKQYDEGRPLFFDIYAGLEVYDVTDFDVSLSLKKPDGNIITMEAQSKSNNIVLFLTTDQMCACHGRSFGEIVIETEGSRIGSANFFFDVEKSPECGGVDGESNIYNLSSQIAALLPEVAPAIITPIVEQEADAAVHAAIAGLGGEWERITAITADGTVTKRISHLNEDCIVDVYASANAGLSVLIEDITITNADDNSAYIKIDFDTDSVQAAYFYFYIRFFDTNLI